MVDNKFGIVADVNIALLLDILVLAIKVSTESVVNTPFIDTKFVLVILVDNKFGIVADVNIAVLLDKFVTVVVIKLPTDSVVKIPFEALILVDITFSEDKLFIVDAVAIKLPIVTLLLLRLPKDTKLNTFNEPLVPIFTLPLVTTFCMLFI